MFGRCIISCLCGWVLRVCLGLNHWSCYQDGAGAWPVATAAAPTLWSSLSFLASFPRSELCLAALSSCLTPGSWRASAGQVRLLHTQLSSSLITGYWTLTLISFHKIVHGAINKFNQHKRRYENQSNLSVYHHSSILKTITTKACFVYRITNYERRVFDEILKKTLLALA